MWLSFELRDQSSQSLQQLQGWRVAPFQNVALALAPRAFVSKFATVPRDRVVEVPGMMLWRDLGLSRRSSYIDPRC
eukprot:1358915-Pyramimonas_sp.AAC.1